MDNVTLAVVIFVGLCFTGAAVLLILDRKKSAPVARSEPSPSSVRYAQPTRVIGTNRMVTDKGELIIRGDGFELVDGGRPIPGTAHQVIGFDVAEPASPIVLLRPFNKTTLGVRPLRVHPRELLSLWVRKEAEVTEDVDRFSGAPTALLPPPSTTCTLETCANCGGKRFRATAESPVACSACGAVFNEVAAQA